MIMMMIMMMMMVMMMMMTNSAESENVQLVDFCLEHSAFSVYLPSMETFII